MYIDVYDVIEQNSVWPYSPYDNRQEHCHHTIEGPKCQAYGIETGWSGYGGQPYCWPGASTLIDNRCCPSQTLTDFYQYL